MKTLIAATPTILNAFIQNELDQEYRIHCQFFRADALFVNYGNVKIANIYFYDLPHESQAKHCN